MCALLLNPLLQDLSTCELECRGVLWCNKGSSCYRQKPTMHSMLPAAGFNASTLTVVLFLPHFHTPAGTSITLHCAEEQLSV